MSRDREPFLTPFDCVILAAATLLYVVAALVGHAFGQGLDLPVVPPPRGAPPAVVSSKGIVQPPAPPPQVEKSRREEPPVIYGDPITSDNSTVAYVIDCSGSMSLDIGEFTDADGGVARGGRLDRAKAELTRSIRSLPQSWRFGIVRYSDVEQIRRWRPGLTRADGPAKTSAAAWVVSLVADGMTATGPAVREGLRDPVKLVVLLTDGEPNVGVPYYSEATYWTGGCTIVWQQHRVMIRDAAKQRGARVDVVGIAASGSLERWCQDVASDNGGTYMRAR